MAETCRVLAAAASKSRCSTSVPSLPPPFPKSPPEYPDLYGKRKEIVKVQMLDREIGFLEEELKSVDSLQPASRCCKEVTDYVVANPDPLIPTNRKNRRSCRFWKWLCGIPCFNFSWICCCCYTGCSFHIHLPRCCDCNCDCDPCGLCNCCSCTRCPAPKCHCCSCSSCFPCHCHCPCSCSCPKSSCCRNISCCSNCCTCRFPSCPDCSCCRFSCPDCSCCRCSCPDCSNCSCCTWFCCCPRWSCSAPRCPKGPKCPELPSVVDLANKQSQVLFNWILILGAEALRHDDPFHPHP
ncbi:hypothetical protein MANES_03G041000v8 [Manihot esculenta]|uniref:Uncharacterized protein n=1 Tax=Manihot esculenta TaxID=3983 RepID=A0ACB7HY75_MANES|nr:hypothetical protein MANES_03G041000v8 [Manihot esculenta]